MRIAVTIGLLLVVTLIFLVVVFVSYTEGVMRVLRDVKKLYGEELYHEFLDSIHKEVNKDE